MKAIINGRVIVPDKDGNFKVLDDHIVLFDDHIRAVAPNDRERCTAADDIFDAGGCYVSPGFINVHVHGCGGFDTMDEDREALDAISRYQAQTGVTAFLPTTMTYDFPRIYKAFERIRAAQGTAAGAAVLGCHMEGPFINKARKGAQAEKNIVKADFALIREYKDIIRIVTLAPETLGGDYGFVDECRKNNIIVSMGHSSADYDIAGEAIKKRGITHVTHLFNGMPPLHHRNPGIAGAALVTDAYCELIADNVHVHPAVQRMTYRLKQRGRLILVTDSMRACLLGDGQSELGGQTVYVKGQKATLADGTIAGSVLTMNRAVANFAAACKIPLPEAAETASRNPAIELGIYDVTGSLEKGKRADITVFDDEAGIKAVWIKGRCAYRQ